jgi:hypothetical protein
MLSINRSFSIAFRSRPALNPIRRLREGPADREGSERPRRRLVIATSRGAMPTDETRAAGSRQARWAPRPAVTLLG